MSHRGHHGMLGVLAVVAAITFAFGERTAQYVVGGTLIAVTLFFAYVMFRIVRGTI